MMVKNFASRWSHAGEKRHLSSCFRSTLTNSKSGNEDRISTTPDDARPEY